MAIRVPKVNAKNSNASKLKIPTEDSSKNLKVKEKEVTMMLDTKNSKK